MNLISPAVVEAPGTGWFGPWHELVGISEEDLESVTFALAGTSPGIHVQIGFGPAAGEQTFFEGDVLIAGNEGIIVTPVSFEVPVPSDVRIAARARQLT